MDFKEDHSTISNVPCRDRNYVKSQEEFNEIEFFVEIRCISTVSNAIFGVDIVEIVSFCRNTESAVSRRRSFCHQWMCLVEIETMSTGRKSSTRLNSLSRSNAFQHSTSLCLVSTLSKSIASYHFVEIQSLAESATVGSRHRSKLVMTGRQSCRDWCLVCSCQGRHSQDFDLVSFCRFTKLVIIGCRHFQDWCLVSACWCRHLIDCGLVSFCRYTKVVFIACRHCWDCG